MNQVNIRNFCIIAHIDHGKSTLADRFLELTGTVEKRYMKEQLLDSMDIERERGITIKLAPVRMLYEIRNSKSEILNKSQILNSNISNSLGFRNSNLGFAGSKFILNLIDTPGHVDFTYEVSRSLAAVEGAVLLTDATQGVQAQTIGNLYLAIEQNLAIIPVVNKIDLPNAEVKKTKAELAHLLGCQEEEILCVSGKTGQGVAELLEAIVERVPPPSSQSSVHSSQSLRALIFDSIYDKYRGAVAYVRVFDGQVKKGDKISFMATRSQGEALEVGYFAPKLTPGDGLSAGEIGYIVTGLRDLSGCRVGDTITKQLNNQATKQPVVQLFSGSVVPLSGYKEVKPMVFAGLFPKEGDKYPDLREAVEKLKLNDAAFTFESERSGALGFGFRCGFLGLLHLEIVEERLRREHEVEVITTVPSVAYRVTRTNGEAYTIKGAQEFPDPSSIEQIEEPWVKIDVVAPREYLGAVMQLVQEKRGVYVNTEYLAPPLSGGDARRLEADNTRVILHYELPLAAILVDFYDKLKSVSSGYASLNYELLNYRPTDVVRLDILVAEDPVEALATIVYADDAQAAGRKIVAALKDTIPRGQFEIKIQAVLGGKVVASERVKPFRKDVTAKLYGGDVTRKMKLLEKQKRGKQKMIARGAGKVDIPPEAYLAVLKR
ncbi:elongation factor 4 [Candidatus Uhrbacteria bacterium]|nr:elongation factor 4 [Candidatus Uhrbacteria bacterium]